LDHTARHKACPLKHALLGNIRIGWDRAAA